MDGLMRVCRIFCFALIIFGAAAGELRCSYIGNFRVVHELEVDALAAEAHGKQRSARNMSESLLRNLNSVAVIPKPYYLPCIHIVVA